MRHMVAIPLQCDERYKVIMNMRHKVEMPLQCVDHYEVLVIDTIQRIRRMFQGDYTCNKDKFQGDYTCNKKIMQRPLKVISRISTRGDQSVSDTVVRSTAKYVCPARYFILSPPSVTSEHHSPAMPGCYRRRMFPAIYFPGIMLWHITTVRH